MKTKPIKSIFLLATIVTMLTLNVAATEPKADTDSPTGQLQLIVELDNFGFKGDFLWQRFTAGMRKAFSDAEIEYELVFKKFPVKSYDNKPALEIRLNHWRNWVPGYREINFWATHVAEDGTETKFGILTNKQHNLDSTYSVMERNFETGAYEACMELAEKLKAVGIDNKTN